MANADFTFLSGHNRLGGPTGGYYTSGVSDMGLFSDVTATESENGNIEYRMFYIKYTGDAAGGASSCALWFDNKSTGVTSGIYVGTGIFSGTGQLIADDSSEPTGVAWSDIDNYATQGGGLTVGDPDDSGVMTEDAYQQIWMRRDISGDTPGDPSESYRINWGGEATS